MVHRDTLEISANLEIRVLDAQTGRVLDVIKKHNLFVTVGKTLIANLLNCTSGVTGLNYFAVGTGTTAAALTDTTLETEVFRDAYTKTTVTAGNLNVRYYLASGDANGNTLTEAGLFGDDATGDTDTGTLAARAVYTGIAKTASIAITYSWDLGIG